MLVLFAHASGAATLPDATDLRRHGDAARRLSSPLIVLVSLHDCAYCTPVRDRQLAPLLRSGRYEIREIEMDSQRSLTDFDGRPITPAAWAKRYNVRVAPTVLFLDRNGRALAQPLVGAGVPDFYGAYLDEAIARSRQRLADERTSNTLSPYNPQ